LEVRSNPKLLSPYMPPRLAPPPVGGGIFRLSNLNIDII